jgi:D-serine deaminase-like pyridoxal phosphate-dependent protein
MGALFSPPKARPDPALEAARLKADADARAEAARLKQVEEDEARARALGVRLRPHVKTTKCGPVVQRQLAAGAAGITVSTLKEAEAFFALGVADILYAMLDPKVKYD